MPLIDLRVLAAAERNWGWAYMLVGRELRDGARAAEIVEAVAIQVTRRLRDDAEVGRNLEGYFRTAVINRVKTEVVNEGRLVYRGTTYDLESSHPMVAPDWTTTFENRMTLNMIAGFMAHPARQILNYRQLGYSWAEIATRVHLTARLARSRFDYGFGRALEALIDLQSRRRRGAKE